MNKEKNLKNKYDKRVYMFTLFSKTFYIYILTYNAIINLMQDCKMRAKSKCM